MSYNFRYPNITGITDREQLAQIKSFLHQLVDQLNYGFSTMDAGTSVTASPQGNQDYGELKDLVMREIQRINSRIDRMRFTEEDKKQIIKEVLAALAEEETNKEE